MYVSGMNPYFGFFFATTTLIIAVPTAIKVYNWVLTLWEGNIHLRTRCCSAIAFIFTFIHGGLTGLFLGNVTIDLPLSDTYFVVAHFHMVMGVSPVLVVFGAIYHWWPKITGKMYNETLGKMAFLDDVPRYLRDLPADALSRLPAGVPRRYFAMGNTEFMPTQSAQDLNAFITCRHCSSHSTQISVLHQRLLEPDARGRRRTRTRGTRRRSNGRRRTTPPKHGNWGHELPVCHRWAYDYSVPGYADDFIPQNVPADTRRPAVIMGSNTSGDRPDRSRADTGHPAGNGSSSSRSIRQPWVAETGGRATHAHHGPLGDSR